MGFPETPGWPQGEQDGGQDPAGTFYVLMFMTPKARIGQGAMVIPYSGTAFC